MSILEFFKNLTMGGWVALFVALSSLVEITPVKIYPIQWLGNRLNKSLMDRVNVIEAKVDEHIAQSYRTKILSFQDSLLIHKYSFFTKEQYDEVIDACEYYEAFCKENKIKNDKCNLAIDYIKRCYEKCQDAQSFANLGEIE